MTYTAKKLLISVYPFLLTVVVAGAFFGPWASNLPDPLATHWGASLTPDGFIGLQAFRVGVLVALTVLAALHPLGLPLGALRGAVAGQVVLLTTATLFVALAGSALSIFAANYGHGDATEIELGLDHIVLVILPILATPLGLLKFLSTRSRASVVDNPATIGLGQGEQAAWFGHLQSPPFLVMALLLPAGIGYIAWSTGRTELWAAAVLSGLVLLVLSRVHVTVRRQGFTVSYGPIYWPRTHIPLDHIAAARAEHIEPMAWGGWGYRGALWLTGKAAVVLRRGPGLVLDLRDGQRFCITVDDPDEAAGLINDLLRRRAVER